MGIARRARVPVRVSNDTGKDARGRTVEVRVGNAQGELPLAIKQYQDALPVFRVLEDPHGEGITLKYLGDAFSSQGQAQQAVDGHRGQGLGQTQGNITAKDRIEMKSSGRVTGDIRAKRLSVEDGVTFVGRSEVNPSGSPLSGVAPVVAAAAAAEESDRTEAATVRSFARR